MPKIFGISRLPVSTIDKTIRVGGDTNVPKVYPGRRRYGHRASTKYGSVPVPNHQISKVWKRLKGALSTAHK